MVNVWSDSLLLTVIGYIALNKKREKQASRQNGKLLFSLSLVTKISSNTAFFLHTVRIITKLLKIFSVTQIALLPRFNVVLL